jgi:hypothetical protein
MLTGVMSSTPKEDSDCRDHTPSNSKYSPAAALLLLSFISESAGAPSRISSPAPCAGRRYHIVPGSTGAEDERVNETENGIKEGGRDRERARERERESASARASARASERAREKVLQRSCGGVRESECESTPRAYNAPYCRPESHRDRRRVHRCWRLTSLVPLPLSADALFQCLPRTRGALH